MLRGAFRWLTQALEWLNGTAPGSQASLGLAQADMLQQRREIDH